KGLSRPSSGSPFGSGRGRSRSGRSDDPVGVGGRLVVKAQQPAHGVLVPSGAGARKDELNVIDGPLNLSGAPTIRARLVAHGIRPLSIRWGARCRSRNGRPR